MRQALEFMSLPRTIHLRPPSSLTLHYCQHLCRQSFRRVHFHQTPLRLSPGQKIKRSEALGPLTLLLAATAFSAGTYYIASSSSLTTTTTSPTMSVAAQSPMPAKLDAASLHAHLLETAKSQPPGRPGNLTAEETAKLKEFWARLLEIFGVYTPKPGSAAAAAPAAAPVAEKKKSGGFFGRKAAEPVDGNDKHGQSKTYQQALDTMTPQELQTEFFKMAKQDSPDAAVLRYLRARKWDVQAALIMLVSTLHWRAKEMKVDEDIMAKGEAGALKDATDASNPTAKKEAEDFITQFRMGKAFIHGFDKQGRPCNYVRVKLHRGGEQTEDSIKRFTVYLIESTRFMIKPPQDTGTIVFDMTGFTLANMDYTPVTFMIKGTKQLHALVTKTHLLQDPFYATKLVRFYASNNNLSAARNLFDKTPQRSVFLWNSIIRAYAQAHKFDDAFLLYTKMIGCDVIPDNYTYACLIRACCESFYFDGLRIVHGSVIISGLGLDSVSCSALVTGYSKMGLVGEASKVFCGVFKPDLVLWNAMISGCGYCGFGDKGLLFFNEMRDNGSIKPDGYTFVALISGLANSSSLELGQGIHGLCLKSGFDCNDHVGSSLVSMYSRFSYINLAYGVFRSLCQPDLVTWSALITGFSQAGEYDKALLFYRNLNLTGKRPDSVLIASTLVATAQLSSVWSGAQIHGYIVRYGFESHVMVSSALIDMYSKCGFVGLGLRVFENMPNRNIVSYNSIISGLGLHGLASQAFDMFTEVLEKGLKPDESTFSALLCACCHAGLIEDGREIFRRMKEEFWIQARTEHYVHIVKLLGMAGELDEAYNFILSLKQPVDSGIWGALLSCCDAHGDSELAEIVAQQLFDGEPKKGAYRVMLSNIYAGDGKWVDVEKMRDYITTAGAEKMPGLSRIGSY